MVIELLEEIDVPFDTLIYDLVLILAGSNTSVFQYLLKS